MEIRHNSILIRNAAVDDAKQLCDWWNDGEVMAHAGFPNGLGTSIEEVTEQINRSNENHCCCVILLDDVRIGEMNYRKVADGICEIGIKICEKSAQNKGLGKIILSLFITALFDELGYQKIVLDTNLTNTRAQHVYEQLGFKKLRTNIDVWVDQLGNKQSSVDYELTQDAFVSYI